MKESDSLWIQLGAIVSLILGLFMACGSCGCSLIPAVVPEVCAAPFVVSLHVDGRWMGGGVSVNNGTSVLVTTHQLDDYEPGDRLEVRTFNCDKGVQVREVKACAEGYGIIRLCVIGEPLPYSAERSFVQPLIGERVTVHGIVTNGRSGLVDGVNRAAVAAKPGDCGGAVLNSDGELVGIVTSYICHREETCTRLVPQWDPWNDDGFAGWDFEATSEGVEWVRP